MGHTSPSDPRDMSDREVRETSEAEGEMRPLVTLLFGVWLLERGRRVAGLPRTRLLILVRAIAAGGAGRGDAIQWYGCGWVSFQA
jgi:hypothetical protein